MFDIFLRNFKDLLIKPLVVKFKDLQHYSITPNHFTIASFLFGLISVYYLWIQENSLSFIYFLVNRLFDGLDGAYARLTNQCSDFGGYLDIIVDFAIYGLIPVAAAASTTIQTDLILMGILEVTFFVNAAGLFFLSALIEKNSKKVRYNQNNEVTTLKMPSALVEGFESFIFFF